MRHIDAETTPSLLLRIRDHADTTAWEDFTAVYSPLVYNFCRLKSLQPSDAADVTQEVMLRVARAIRNFEYDPKVGLFRDWLARIVHNEIARFCKAASYTTELSAAVPVDASEAWNEHFQTHIFEAAIERCRQKFTPQTWSLFEETWLQKVPVRSLAKKLNIGAEKIYLARSRVLKQLRREVALLAEEWTV